ncbi:MAG: hypothetical protein JWN56_1038 [Sphingobacteriales bacterium]|nr:hypothetical protein [Sphingobacteriales bacterium]
MDAFEISVTLATGLVDLTIKSLMKESDPSSHYYTVVMDKIDFTIIRKNKNGEWENVQGHVLNEHELKAVSDKIEVYHL